ncbi:hypothetical protein ACI65C_004434 [Semiaphis heraclei]
MENKQNNCGLTNGLPEFMALKNEETEMFVNGEPMRKKLKTEKTDLEIPKLILSKNRDTFEPKLKYSKLQPSKNSHLITLPDRLNTKNDVEPSNNEKCMINNHDKKEETKEMKESVTNNSLLIGKIKIRNVNTINASFTEINSFETEKSDVSNTNSPFVFPPLGTKKLTILFFEQLHKKYFNKNVQDTLVINNNILFVYMLANKHSASRINLILTGKVKHDAAWNVYKLSVLHLNYLKKIDKMLQTNIIYLISIFDDSDFEHGFLMIILCLFLGLKMLASNIFEKSNIILAKFKILQWEVIKEKNIRNKIKTTLESDTFCSCYYKISEMIGEGSHTDLNIIKCWKLFFIPAVHKITCFNSVSDAIVNDTDADKLDSLLEEASNKVRLNSYSLSNTKIENLIALVNKPTQKKFSSSGEMAQPITSGYTTVENTSSVSIQNISTPNIVHTKSLRIEEPNMTIPKYKSKVCGVKNASTFIPEESKDWFKTPMPVQSQQTSTLKKNASTFFPEELKEWFKKPIAVQSQRTSTRKKNAPTFFPEKSKNWFKKPIPVQSQRTSTRKKNAPTFFPEESKNWFNKPIPVQSQRPSTRKKNPVPRELKMHYEDYSNTPSTNIPLLSLADRVKLRKTRNTSAAVSKTSEDSHKTLRSIKSEPLNTPSMVHTRITRSSKLNMNCNDPPKKKFKKIHATNQIEVPEAKNTTTAVPSKPDDLLKLPFTIKNENKSFPHIFYVSVSEQNRLNKKSPPHTNISTTSILKHGEDSQVINCTSKLSTNVCMHEKVNSTIKTVNLQHGLNGNKIISKSK